MKAPIKYLFIWFVIVMCIGAIASAQKLPNVQSTSIYAPANLKIDGKATEWNNQFQAFNKSTSLYYTMANNADNLYLILQATNRTAIEKMLGGGITLTIANKNNSVSISTPFTSSPNRANIVKALRNTDRASETELNELNKGLEKTLKEIKLKGISAIPDSAISVYNNYGIKTAGFFDGSKSYTYELVIPLKYLSPQLTDAGSFDYTVKLNGLTYKFTNSNGQTGEIPPLIMAAGPMAGGPSASGGNGQTSGATSVMDLITTTDFSGTYTLAKK